MSSLFRTALAFILSVLPLLVLHFDASNEHQRQKSEIMQAQKNRFKILAEKVSRQTEISFWVEEIGRRFKREIFQNGGKPLETISGFSEAMGSAAAKASFAELPRAKFWGVFFSDITHRKGQLVLQANLEQGDSAFFERLTTAIAKNHRSKVRSNDDSGIDLDSVSWQNQIKRSFGQSVSSSLFSQEYRGKAFHVIYKGSPGILLWDFLFVRGTLRGAMVVFQPIVEGFETIPLLLTLNNWKEAHFKPAFFSFPTGMREPEKIEVNVHEALKKSGIPKLLLRWGKRIKIIPLNDKTQSPPSIRTGAPFLYQLQSLEEKGIWQAFFFPVSPLAGSLGALVCKSPEAPRQFIEDLSFLARLIVIFSWIFYFMQHVWFQSFPQFGIQWQLFFWFIGLLGMPAALSLGAMVRLSGDIISNRTYELQTDLVIETKQLEASANKINENLNELMRKTCDDRFLIDKLEKLRFQSAGQKTFMDDLFSRLTLGKVSPTALFIIGPKKFLLEKFDRKVYSGFRTITRKVFQEGYEEEFTSYNPANELEENDSNSVSLGSLSGNFGETKNTFYLRGNYYSLIKQELLENHAVKFQIVSIWNETPLFKPSIEEAQKKSAFRLENQGIDLQVFQICGNNLNELKFNQLGKPAHVPLIRHAYLAMNQTYFQRRDDRGDLIYAFPSRRYHGYIIAGRVSLESIRDEYNAALIRLLGIWLGLIILTIATIQFLAERITRPIQKMTGSLLQVTQENFQIHVTESRKDELGEAGKTLQKMICWLEERSRVSKFVVPQVMELLGAENYSEALNGIEKKVVVLCSDIRDFTTLTEIHPPREIFSLLNLHMDAMATIIKDEGGFIDRFVGDAIQAVFYEDLRRSETFSPAFASVRAAVRMMEKFKEIVHERSVEGLFTYQIGIGIESDLAIVGVVGTEKVRQDFIVLGEIIKKASELEAASKSGQKSHIIVSQKMKDETQEMFDFLPLGGVSKAWELSDLKIDLSLENNSSPLKTSKKKIKKESERTNTLQSSQPRWFPWHSWSSCVAFLFWLIPLIILPLTLQPWLNVITRDSEIDIESQMKEIIPTLDARFNPLLQASLFLESISRQLEADQVGAIQSAEKSINQLFPDAYWYVLSPLESNSASVTIVASNPLIKSPFLPDSTIKDMFDYLYGRHLLSPNSDRDLYPKEIEFITRLFPDASFQIGKQNYLDCVYKGLGNLFPIRIQKKRMLFYWNPLFTTDSIFKGGLAIFIPIEALQVNTAIDCLFENMKKEGFEVSISNLSNQKVLRRSPDFPPFTNETLSTGRVLRKKNGWIIAGDVIQRNAPYEILIAKSLPAISGMNRLVLISAFLFSVLWVFGGIPVFFYRQSLLSRLNFPLLRQMLTAFSFVLFPALFVTAVIIDQSHRELYRRTIFESHQEFRERLHNTTEGARAVLGFAYKVFAKECQNFFKTNFVQKEVASNTIFVNDSRMVQFEHALNFQGLTFVNIGLVHRNYHLGSIGLSKSMLEIGANLFLKALAPPSTISASSEKSAKTAAKIEFLSEEVQTLLGTIVPADANSEMYLSPASIVSVGESGNVPRTFISRFHLSDKNVPIAVIYAQFWTNSLLFHVLNEYESPHSFSISRSKYPGWILTPSYGIFPAPSSWEKQQRPPIKDQFVPSSTSFRKLTLLAKEIKESTWNIEGTGLERKLFMAVSENVLSGYALVGILSLNDVLRPIFLLVQFQYTILLFVGILGLYLARTVSKQFLTPILSLSQKTRAIMNHDFSARLAVQSSDEFGELAKSFNQMAQGVQEGRILRRFVSDSVLETAVSNEEQFLAKNGQIFEAVILFAQLRNMKQRQARLTPAELIKDLNGFLAEMSTIIYEKRGEIDKFIGEKIMAVFSEKRFGNIESARIAALNVSEKMRQKITLIPGFSNDSLAIGMASGKVLGGILGSEAVRLEHTVIGDKVNQAARLLDIADKSGGGIVLEDSFIYLSEKNLPENFPWNRNKIIGDILVKGKEKTIRASYIPPKR
ncbi:MAG: HAMP domain-containing protein [Candidatus Riflebacteria bacterium]|nr:HAMP domain-containing protein [Candidatus Riflebacteria bacterium]